MLPQASPHSHQTQSSEVATHSGDLTAGPFIPATDEDTILRGEMAYNYLASSINPTPGQYFSDQFGYFPPPGYTYGVVHPVPSSSGSIISPSVSDTSSLPPLPPSPSPSGSSSTPEGHTVSLEPSPTPEPGCRNAVPVFNHIRTKWCCSVCDKPFRGKWECRRHIGITGKRVMCLACGCKLSGREDSMRRHFAKYCKGDVQNFTFEDVFTQA